MSRTLKLALVLGALLSLGTATSAEATPTFDFNSLSPSAGNASTAVSTYMTNTLNGLGCLLCSVTVTGAAADRTYNGDGHVVGPTTTGSPPPAVKSLTLGNTDGATGSTPTSSLNSSYDTFLANTTDGRSQISQQIDMIFSGIQITSVSFDFQIFPDGSCTALTYSGCGGATVGGIRPNQPDLEFIALAGINPVVTWTKYGVAPGTSPVTATHSPVSGDFSTETAPQLIGTWSSGVLSTPVTELDFIDWPATIGIDNLNITYNVCGLLGCIQGGPPTSVPTPASLPLVVTGLLLGWALWRTSNPRA